MKKKSSIFSFQVIDILTSILSALHPFPTLPNDDLLSLKETIRNPKILATSQMDKMAPENVTTSGTLKLDA